MTVDTFYLFGGIVPFSVEVLRTKLTECEEELSSHLVTAIAVKLQVIGNKTQDGVPVMLMPFEEERDEFGLGHLPLLMVMGFLSYWTTTTLRGNWWDSFARSCGSGTFWNSDRLASFIVINWHH